jgi:spore maturation protein CgeB
LVNVSFDDSHAFWGAKRAGVFRGQAELCCHFDINITLQRREDVFKYEMTGGDAIFLYPGGNQLLWGNMEMRAKRDIPISFIGKKYGRRGEIVDYILENNIPITTGGIGFGKPLSQEEMKNVYGRSLMTLGVGYNGNTKKTALKGRDFEVPLTGCAYLTTFNRELASCFEEGKEILFYHNKKDLVKKIQYYRNREEECVEIGRRGQTKAQNQHTWGKRWEYLLQILTGKVIFD